MKQRVKYTVITILSLLGIATLTFLYSRPRNRALFISPIHKIETEEKIVALTFDDGPSDVRTPALLEMLEKYKVKATFFMLGINIEKYPDIAQSVFDHGHLIGNHSYNHPRFLLKSPAFTKDQIQKTDILIQSLGQFSVECFRPPYSFKHIILPLVLKALKKKLVTGTYDPPAEYLIPYDAKNIANEVIENTQPGSIIYLHDGKGTDKEAFVESVELIINGLQEKGYKFVTLDY